MVGIVVDTADGFVAENALFLRFGREVEFGAEGCGHIDRVDGDFGMCLTAWRAMRCENCLSVVSVVVAEAVEVFLS
jgi:hypothetical protein